MNGNDQHLGDELGQHLRHRVDGLHDAPLTLGDVQGKARTIRRNRWVAGAASMAAAVAIIVPVALFAGQGLNRSDAPGPGPATSSPSPTQTATTDKAPDEGRQPAPGVLDVSDLPTGAAPALDYVLDGTLHLADGEAEVGTRYPPQQLVELADGARVWQTTDQGTPYIEIQDTDGSFHDPVRSNWGLSVNRPRSIVAWLSPSGQVTIWEGWASEPRPLGDPVPGSDLRLGPVTGVGQAAPGQAGPSCDESTCAVIVNVAGDPWQPWEVTESGTQPVNDGSFLSIADQNEAGLTVGYDEITDSGSCSKLLGGGEFQGWSTCKHTLVSFSPDGSTVLADPAYHDGIGNGEIAMYDAGTGEPLFSRSSTRKVQSFYSSAVWEDDTHVLLPIFQDSTWSIVRIGSDGSMEYAVEPVRGEAEQNPFVIALGS